MNSRILIVIVIGAIVAAGAFILKLTQPISDLKTKANLITITSPAFKNNQFIPARYTCDGENISPPLSFGEIPAASQSLVLMVDDPDAPAGTWNHWTVWNIDPSTTKIGENSLPTGVTEGLTSFGTIGYGGPCPPSGTHRYFFKLYALDTKLNLPQTTPKKELASALAGHLLGQAELIGLYSQK